MKILSIYLICFILWLPIKADAQFYSIKGQIKDAKDTSALIGVTVMVVNISDSTLKTGTTTDNNGYFKIDHLSIGKYGLRAEYIGYNTIKKLVSIIDNDINLDALNMTAVENELKGTTIAGKQIRADQNGDTTSFHADAYKTHPDANAEDLVAKMPGITSDNSGVKVNGEAVQQVYVDGKPFFGTDPILALRNLPAEVIDKIQVFDALSDQARFTGFDDGSSQKTINITTKKNKSEGVFGRVYAGYGTDDNYLTGGNLNIFKGDQRISILALSNNINQQNFSAQDILGVSGGSGSGGRGGGGMGGAFGGGAGGGGSNNFMVNQQKGITTTNSAGFNYSDNWGKKVKVTGSYFYNSTDNLNISGLTRDYFTGSESGNVYYEKDSTRANNFNNRINFRLEYTIDSYNTIIFTPALNFQKTINYNVQTDSTVARRLLSSTLNNTGSNNTGYSSTNNILLQHKFKKPRRTLSLNINNSLNEKNAPGNIYTNDNEFNYSYTINTLFNQNYSLYNNGYTIGGNLTYTEPIGKKSQLMVNYNPSYSSSLSNKYTYNYDSIKQTYSDFDTIYSNKYNSTYFVQKGGLSFRIGGKQLNLNIGANLQFATLDGTQIYPYGSPINRDFTNVLPIAFFNYRFEDGRNLRIMYRTTISAPSVTELQDVVDVTNPLLLNTGNPKLRQDYEQTIIVRYAQTKSKSAHNFFVYLYGNLINNYIGNATYQPTKDSSFQGPLALVPIKIARGSQLTVPINLNGYANAKTFATYSVPADFVKCNLNFNGGFSYTRAPGIVNTQTNYSSNYVPTCGIVLSSNVSEKLDFTLSYTGNYNIVKNTLQTQTHNNYYNHTSGFKINWIFFTHFVLNSNITHSYYTAFSSTGNQSFFLWTSYIGYKLLKKQALEIRLTAFDLLNENKSITRTVTGTYIENDITNVLKQYFMLQLTYTIRNFKGALPTAQPEHVEGGMNWRDRMR